MFEFFVEMRGILAGLAIGLLIVAMLTEEAKTKNRRR